MSHDPIEFICIDCDCKVFAFGTVAQRLRCATCEWINNLPDEEDRVRLRKWLEEIDDGREKTQGTQHQNNQN